MSFDGRSEQAEWAIGLQLVGAALLIAFAQVVEGMALREHWQAGLIVLLLKAFAVLMVVKGAVMRIKVENSELAAGGGRIVWFLQPDEVAKLAR